MALKFQGGRASEVDGATKAKLVELQKEIQVALKQGANAQVAARAIGGMNNWTARVTAIFRDLDALNRDLYRVINNR